MAAIPKQGAELESLDNGADDGIQLVVSFIYLFIIIIIFKSFYAFNRILKKMYLICRANMSEE